MSKKDEIKDQESVISEQDQTQETQQPESGETVQTSKLDQELNEKIASLNDKYIRLYSEYENYRKRTSQEKADLLINGSREMIKAILPVVDDLERAINNSEQDEGIKLIYNKLMKILGQKGLKMMEVEGQIFDENLHEAISRIPAQDEKDKGKVVDIIEKGYFLNDKVLRYAKVIVAY